jgi:predicted aldo/keto reductase-like oxidoreductase
MKKQNKIDRRNFLKAVGAAGLAPAFAGMTNNEPNAPDKTQQPKFPQVPKRKLGKTGVEIPCLSLGANRLDNQTILRAAFQWGVNYWDTANSYVGGNSEIEIGKFLSKNPDARKQLFIVTKASGAKTVADVEERLADSLKKMNTEYIDLYYGVHGLSDPAQLTDELKQWVENAKKRKLIRFFGFSIHKNNAQCLTAVAKLGWIDALMTSYNFRLMQDNEITDAVDACHKAGVGLIAMKTIAFSIQERRQMEAGGQIDTEQDKKLIQHFLQRGFTEEQAKIKAVLEDERFSSACVGMNNVATLTPNVAAVLDKTKLTQADKNILKQYAEATCTGYCAGCADICDSVLPDTPYVSDIMRYLMYYNSYGDRQHARQLFAQIPGSIRNKLLSIDYSAAETRCPQQLPIGKFVAEAVSKLA